jgi:pyruvate-formate lyase-activating enzyme
MTDGLVDLFNVDLKFMNDLKHVVQECDLGHDNKRIIAQIDEVIAEWK